jgi:hypothetical protein
MHNHWSSQLSPSSIRSPSSRQLYPFPGGHQLRNSGINNTTLYLDLVKPDSASRPRFQDACIPLLRFNFFRNEFLGCRRSSTVRRIYRLRLHWICGQVCQRGNKFSIYPMHMINCMYDMLSILHGDRIGRTGCDIRRFTTICKSFFWGSSKPVIRKWSYVPKWKSRHDECSEKSKVRYRILPRCLFEPQ